MMFEPLSTVVEEEISELRRWFLDGVAGLEVVLDEVLSILLERGKYEQDLLYENVIWRVALDKRIPLFLKVLEDSDLADRFPFLAPMREVIVVRNILAHMVLDLFESSDEVLIYNGRRQGEIRQIEVRMDRLRSVNSMLAHIMIDLRLVRDYLVEREGLQASPASSNE